MGRPGFARQGWSIPAGTAAVSGATSAVSQRLRRRWRGSGSDAVGPARPASAARATPLASRHAARFAAARGGASDLWRAGAVPRREPTRQPAGSVVKRRNARLRAVIARCHLAQDHEQDHKCQPRDGNQDEEHLFALSIEGGPLSSLSEDADLALNFPAAHRTAVPTRDQGLARTDAPGGMPRSSRPSSPIESVHPETA
jgi:hypothetical protein